MQLFREIILCDEDNRRFIVQQTARKCSTRVVDRNSGRAGGRGSLYIRILYIPGKIKLHAVPRTQSNIFSYFILFLLFLSIYSQLGTESPRSRVAYYLPSTRANRHRTESTFSYYIYIYTLVMQQYGMYDIHRGKRKK